jgi:glycine/sarcosine N-methyltransferase
MDTAQSYDALANQYHLIFEDWEASIKRQATVLSSIFKQNCRLTSTAQILDCACGIGTQTLGLAKLGFRVHGCDFSSKAVERARLEASRKSLDIQFSVANMLDLSSLGGSHFDAVICMDNSLPHLESIEQIVRAAEQIRARLKPGGFFMASTRDYDRLIRERPTVDGPFFYTDGGHRRIVFQVWDWLDGRRYAFHLYITRRLEQGWQTFHMSAIYRAVLRNELLAALSHAQFKNARWLFPAETGFYQPILLAEAP